MFGSSTRKRWQSNVVLYHSVVLRVLDRSGFNPPAVKNPSVFLGLFLFMAALASPTSTLCPRKL